MLRAALASAAFVFALSSGTVLAAEPTALGSSSGSYAVQPGDTLSGIAAQLGVPATDLISVNDIGDPDLLSVGEVLRLPSGASVATQRPSLSSRASRPAGTWAWPVNGPITTYFGERGPLWSRGWHPGLDIGVPVGTPIGAGLDGVVIEAESSGWNSGYGSYVKIDHGNGLVTLYAHMSRVSATVGQQVSAGDVLGYVGLTGATTGPHLHFEVRVDGQVTDPLKFLP